MERHRTAGDRGHAEFEVQGSEFLGLVRPVDAVDRAEAFVDEVRAEYPDATHHVPAYRVRDGGMTREYQSDDGEPTGSSGKPALNVLQQRELLNLAAVVVRYYGGTNLGVGGLARAYSRAVKEAVDDAGVVEERPHERLRVAVDYDDSGTVRSVLESEGVEFDADYGERATFAVRVPVAEAGALRDRLRSATGGRADFEDT
ncbi:MAG: YigZ family protein [Haloarculaceae archaeon]